MDSDTSAAVEDLDLDMFSAVHISAAYSPIHIELTVDRKPFREDNRVDSGLDSEWVEGAEEPEPCAVEGSVDKDSAEVVSVTKRTSEDSNPKSNHTDNYPDLADFGSECSDLNSNPTRNRTDNLVDLVGDKEWDSEDSDSDSDMGRAK